MILIGDEPILVLFEVGEERKRNGWKHGDGDADCYQEASDNR